MKRVLLIIGFSLSVIIQMSGQSLSFLNISSDPYVHSMGGNTLTLEESAFTVSNNASAMPFSKETGHIAASYISWMPDNLNQQLIGLSGFHNINRFSYGLSGKYYIHSPYEITNNQGFSDGQFTPSEFSVDIAFSYRIIKGLSAGISLRYVNSVLSDKYKARAYSTDISVSYRTKSLRIAIAATNIGSKVDYGTTPYNMPMMAKVGIGYILGINEKNSIGIHAEGDFLVYKKNIMASLGAEYSYNDMVFIRAGYHYGNISYLPSYASTGIGLRVFGINLSGAYILGLDNSPINGTYMFSLGYQF